MDCEDYLRISAIQHYSFCKRQWALIDIELYWEENAHTIHGKLMHNKAHDPTFGEKRGDLLVSRAMPIISHQLKIVGVCDIVEFVKDENGVPLKNREGKYRLYPVEYKKGMPKNNDCDVLQLVAQVMCLEEMFVTDIDFAFIYYGSTKKREKVEITEELRNKVAHLTKEMRDFYQRSYIPRVKETKACFDCSLKDLCMPQILNKKKVNDYIQKHLLD